MFSQQDLLQALTFKNNKNYAKISKSRCIKSKKKEDS